MKPARHPPVGPRAGRAAGLWAMVRSRFALDLRSLAAFRVAIGTILVADAILRTRDFGLMFSPDGFFPLPTLRQTWGSDRSIWSAAFLVDRAWWGGVVLAVQGLAGLCLACGWNTRLASIAAWAAQLSVMRRTLPATNAGDSWLGAMLFWAMFLPLGAVWSADAARRSTAGRRTGSTATMSPASAALMLQVLVVYVAAGVAKCNASWLSGDAIRRALSVHDHGTPFGTWLVETVGLTRPLTWLVLGVEIVLPLLFLLVPRPRVRLAIVAIFMLFHLAIQATMSVGLFAMIGIAAWLALIPGDAWNSLASRTARHTLPPPAGGADPGRLPPLPLVACAVAFTLAAVGFIHGLTPWQSRPLPRAVAVPLNLCGLVQEWGMFGVVYATEQWVYAPARLADGRRVDLLRGGGPVEEDRPRGGFGSLPHHRWHKLVWMLPQPRFRPLAPHVAAALVRDWNARHPAEAQVESLEIRFVMEDVPPAGAARLDQLLATWPPRGPEGTGNLGRFLDAADGREP